MGRIKTVLVKRATQKLVNTHETKLTKDFDENKKMVDTLVTGYSKKTRNVIAGYTTRLMKKGKERSYHYVEPKSDSPRRRQ